MATNPEPLAQLLQQRLLGLGGEHLPPIAEVKATSAGERPRSPFTPHPEILAAVERAKARARAYVPPVPADSIRTRGEERERHDVVIVAIEPLPGGGVAYGRNLDAPEEHFPFALPPGGHLGTRGTVTYQPIRHHWSFSPTLKG